MEVKELESIDKATKTKEKLKNAFEAFDNKDFEELPSADRMDSKYPINMIRGIYGTKIGHRVKTAYRKLTPDMQNEFIQSMNTLVDYILTINKCSMTYRSVVIKYYVEHINGRECANKTGLSYARVSQLLRDFRYRASEYQYIIDLALVGSKQDVINTLHLLGLARARVDELQGNADYRTNTLADAKDFGVADCVLRAIYTTYHTDSFTELIGLKVKLSDIESLKGVGPRRMAELKNFIKDRGIDLK